MNLESILAGVEVVKVHGELNVEIVGVADDSRKVKKGYLFVAISGLTVDGHDFIPTAIKAGASVIVGEKKPKKSWLKDIVYVQIVNSRKALSFVASNWNENPSKELKVIGVTGTDGKTTTANILYHLLNSAGKKVGLITTINAIIGNREVSTGLHTTNPEPLKLHAILKQMVDAELEYAILEVTSHGLDQGRVAGIEFEVGVLTNITHEHLDYHKDFEEYRKVKASLFENAKKLAVLNKDDDNYDYIKSKVADNVHVISYSTKGKADVVGKVVSIVDGGMDYEIKLQDRVLYGGTNLVGEYNLQNILAAVSVADYCKISTKDIAKALEDIKGLSGRMESIKNDLGIRIIVDFAHTPNSLEKVLTELRKATKGKLITVFGCAGERDVEKRKLMPTISVGVADLSIFTAEDPRSEDVNDILGVMEKSVKDINNANYSIIPDRGEAIYKVINEIAKKGDTVAILGKGHEKSMCYGTKEYPWSDQEAVQDALAGKVKKVNRK